MVTILKQNLTHFVYGTKAYAKAFVHIAEPIKIDSAISADKKEERRKIFAQRDEALSYFEANKINGSTQKARKNWKKLVGYHQRSLVETTMFRIKAHTGSWLKSKNPKNMTTETKIKCKLLNILNLA
jgi:effector-binding domain-containing protein